MCLLIESIKIKDGRVFNINYHNDRMNVARRTLFGSKQNLDLGQVISGGGKTGVIKCRVIFDRKIREIQYISYEFPEIHTLKIVVDDTITYNHKYKDRRRLQRLYERRNGADDILIVKNGRVTDSFFCNLVFERSGLFFTPVSCLLKGTKRQQLLEEGKVKEADIKVEELRLFDKLYLINAMIDLDDRISVDMERIAYI